MTLQVKHESVVVFSVTLLNQFSFFEL